METSVAPVANEIKELEGDMAKASTNFEEMKTRIMVIREQN